MKKLSQKIAAFAMLAFISVENIYAQNAYLGDGGAGKRILLDESKLENGRKDLSDVYLSNSLKSSISNDIVNFSNVEVINSDDMSSIKKAQKNSESFEINEKENVVEIGKLVNAAIAVNLTVTRNSNNMYRSSYSVLDINRGVRLGGDNTKFYSEADFLNFAHGEIAAGILKKLDVQLTAAGERLIKTGSLSDLSLESESGVKDELELIETELKRTSDLMKKIDREKMTSVEYEAKQTQQKARLETLEIQKKNAEERLRRIQEDAKRIQAERMASKERSDNLNKKILERTKKIEENAKLIRQKKTDSMTAAEKIFVIESEKKTLLETLEMLQANIEEIRIQADEDLKKRLDAIDEKYSKNNFGATFFTKDNKLNSDGMAMKNDEISLARKENANFKASKELEVHKKTDSLIASLKTKITADIKELESETYKVNSLHEGEVYFRVDEFDSEKDGWNYVLVHNFGGTQVYSAPYDALLTYKNITGKDSVSYKADPKTGKNNKDEVMEYHDELQVLDSYFRMNVPYIFAEISFKIRHKAYPAESKYEIVVDTITFKRVVEDSSSKKNGATDFTIYNSDSGWVEYKFVPGTNVDWRDSNTVKVADVLAKKELRQKQENERKARELEEEKQRKAEEERERELERREREIRKQVRAENAEYRKSQQRANGAIGIGVSCFNYRCTQDIYLEAVGTIPLGKYMFIGAVGGVGLNVSKLSHYESSDSKSNSNTNYSSSSSNSSLASYLSNTSRKYEASECFVFEATGRAGFNYTFGQVLRVSLFGEAGLISNSFGYDGGLTFELMGDHVGFYGTYAAGKVSKESYTGLSKYFDKYVLGLKFLF